MKLFRPLYEYKLSVVVMTSKLMLPCTNRISDMQKRQPKQLKSNGKRNEQKNSCHRSEFQVYTYIIVDERANGARVQSLLL